MSSPKAFRTGSGSRYPSKCPPNPAGNSNGWTERWSKHKNLWAKTNFLFCSTWKKKFTRRQLSKIGKVSSNPSLMLGSSRAMSAAPIWATWPANKFLWRASARRIRSRRSRWMSFHRMKNTRRRRTNSRRTSRCASMLPVGVCFFAVRCAHLAFRRAARAAHWVFCPITFRPLQPKSTMAFLTHVQQNQHRQSSYRQTRPECCRATPLPIPPPLYLKLFLTWLKITKSLIFVQIHSALTITAEKLCKYWRRGIAWRGR